MGETIEIDLRELGRVLLKRIWIIVLCTALLGVSVLVYTVSFVSPQYTAGVTMYVNNNSGGDSGYVSSNDLAVAIRLVGTYINIIKSDAVLEKVAEDAGLMLTAGQIRGMMEAETVGDTEMFQILITTPNPQMSADIANTIAKIAPEEISNIIEGSSAKVIDYAKVPTKKSSPNYLTNTVIGMLCGMVISTLAIAAMHLLDMRIKNEQDLERICAAPVLGVIPEMNLENKGSGKKVRR